MKVSRYSASGKTHSSGMGATFWLRCVVIETSRIEAQAARATHNARVPTVTLSSMAFNSDSATLSPATLSTTGSGAATGAFETRLTYAAQAHTSAKAIYPALQ